MDDDDSCSSDEELNVRLKSKDPEHKMIQRSHYQQITTILVAEIDKLVIDVNTPDKFSLAHLAI